MPNDHGVRTNGKFLRIDCKPSGWNNYEQVSGTQAQWLHDAIRRLIADAVATERKRIIEWINIADNESARAYKAIAEGRDWRDG